MKWAKVRVKVKKEVTRLLTRVVSPHSMEAERMLIYVFVFFVLCHTLACLWFLLAKLSEFHERTWVVRYDYMDEPVGTQYMAALYFIVTTITTVGYGDITAKAPEEQLFALILMIIGVVSYSLAISALMTAISASNERNKRLRSKLDVLARVRTHYRLNFDLYWRLRQALHYDHSTDMSDQHALLNELPPKLHVELSHLIYSQQIDSIPYFHSKSPNFIATVAPLLKPLNISKGEYVFLKGDSLDGVYFIKRGEAAYVERRPKADLIFATHRDGAYFGDIDFTASD